MFTFILPMFGDMFTDMELPLMTRILMGMSDFLTHYWYVAIGVVAAIVVDVYKRQFHHLPHGVANALLITDIMRYNIEDAPQKMEMCIRDSYSRSGNSGI